MVYFSFCRIRKQRNVSLATVSLFLLCWTVLNCYSARFDFQRLSAVGSTGVMDLWFVLMLVCNSYDISLCVNVEFLCTSCPHSFLFTLHLINSFITRGHMVIAVAAVILK